ncbi:hypothetical protein BMWSH_1305 [Priestia megaterium WSH-002]|uniref:Uncharacterized protein n=1 Tax=Priestia megaterium (strain WSH-002) TaxID=1006007 RepID=A0A8D3WWM3_PRIMW|nr:hypothetical protein BMWSH_1305 [Priestia megaterium WSH-002]
MSINGHLFYTIQKNFYFSFLSFKKISASTKNRDGIKQFSSNQLLTLSSIFSPVCVYEIRSTSVFIF